MWNQIESRKEVGQFLKRKRNLREHLDAIHALVVLIENELVVTKHSPEEWYSRIGTALYDVVTIRKHLEESDELLRSEWEAIIEFLSQNRDRS